MRAVIQRTFNSKLFVNNELISEIPSGLTIFIGITEGDTFEQAKYFAQKMAKLRVFRDENGKMNVDIKAVDGEILLISQFTLYADCTHGNRPGFTKAGNPAYANEMYEKFGQRLKDNGMTVKTGVFGADMRVDIQNVGPVTIMLDSKELLKK